MKQHDPEGRRQPRIVQTCIPLHRRSLDLCYGTFPGRDRQRFLCGGFQGYISKPIDIKRFADSVRGYCETPGMEG